MTDTSILALSFALLQQLVFCGMWLAVAALGLSPQSTRPWALGSLALGLHFVLAAMRPVVSPWVGYALAHALGVAAVLLLHVGIRRLGQGRLRPARYAAALLVAMVLHAAAVAAGRPHLVIAVTGVAFALVLAAGAREMLALRGEFGALAARAFAAPLAAAALAQAVRGLWLLTAGGADTVAGRAESGPSLAVAIGSSIGALVINMAMLALVSGRLVARLRHLGGHDGLTGLPNRGTVEVRLAEQASLLRRHGTPHALLVVDVDHFKSINDRFGHPAGDAALRAVAEVLRSQCRVHDVAGRCGGEEFWVVLPHTAREGAWAMAERIVAAMHALDVAQVGALTVSVGVAVADDPNEAVERLVARADAALYRAKRGGRDRVEVDDGADRQGSGVGGGATREALGVG